MVTTDWSAWASGTTEIGTTLSGVSAIVSGASGETGTNPIRSDWSDWVSGTTDVEASAWSEWVSGTTLPEWSTPLTITTTGESAGTTAVVSGSTGTLPRSPASGVVSVLSTASGSLDLVSGLVGSVELVTTVIGAVELRQVAGVVEVITGVEGTVQRHEVSGTVALRVITLGEVSAQGPISYDAMALAQEIVQRLSRPKRRRRWVDPSAAMHGGRGSDSSLYWYGR